MVRRGSAMDDVTDKDLRTLLDDAQEDLNTVLRELLETNTFSYPSSERLEKDRDLLENALENTIDLYEIKKITRLMQLIYGALDEYQRRQKPRMIPRNYTLREDQIRKIKDYSADNQLNNVSAGLRDLIDIAFDALK
jgi:transcription initiation factor IIE alpha subunit